VGRNISHSFSPAFFKQKFLKENFRADYRLFDIASVDELLEIIRLTPNLSGFNVTIPYKTEIMAFLDEIAPEAEIVGAVNTIKVTNKGLKGFNTDVIGFRESLKPMIKGKPFLSALVLGNGGASKAIKFVLHELSIPFQQVSRAKTEDVITYQDIDKLLMEKTLLIINTTPMGMFPAINNAPEIPYKYLTKHHILFDLIYNPEETLFLQEGRKVKCQTKNGLEMLHFQAEASWKIWQREKG